MSAGSPRAAPSSRGEGSQGRHRCGPGARGRGPAPGWPGPPRPPSPGPRPLDDGAGRPGVGGDVGDLGAGVPRIDRHEHRAQSKHPERRDHRGERRRGAPEHRSPPPPEAGQRHACSGAALVQLGRAHPRPVAEPHGRCRRLLAHCAAQRAGRVIMAGPGRARRARRAALTPAIRPRQHGSHGAGYARNLWDEHPPSRDRPPHPLGP